MRSNSSANISLADASVSQDGVAIPASQVLYVSAQCISTGTSTGSVQLEFSDDPASICSIDSNGNLVPVNWSILGTAATVTAASTTSVAVTQVCAQFIRAAYTASNADAGTITVNINTQGV